ncbi:hypothetical protein PRIPAC_76793 [Pristionchus pacificus]|uniref:Uncharacterized protein n=1 Tax=Pristionchus pacificus TaxID=54126 RepID=A0A2A6BWL5_PRIPA|nr:hypothetical protein PRIPAC_76793 [Pristionchus pacificus]|eukprot:PDM70268.1 hypothetical protein PRIPAC_46514 [Pristionchus pacificus]
MGNRLFGEVHTADVANAWEMLTPVKNENGSWSFKSRSGYYLSAHLTYNEVNFQPHNDRCEQWTLELLY